MKKIEIAGHLSYSKLRRNKNIDGNSLYSLIAFYIIPLYNETLDLYDKYFKSGNNVNVISKLIVFNLFMLEKLIVSIGKSVSLNKELKDMRDAIAHFDERLKAFLKPNNGIVSVEYPNYKTTWIYDKNGRLVSTKADISIQKLGGIHIDTTKPPKTYISSPFGFIENNLVSINSQNETILLELNDYIFIEFEKSVLEIIDFYSISSKVLIKFDDSFEPRVIEHIIGTVNHNMGDDEEFSDGKYVFEFNYSKDYGLQETALVNNPSPDLYKKVVSEIEENIEWYKNNEMFNYH